MLLQAIVATLKVWEHMLKSCHEEFVVYRIHKNLEYIATTRVLSMTKVSDGV